ncbi:fkbM_fam, methyltransferase, FkbM family [uncultured Caudovirales phage]|uniref:FkbM_fam, methyltransferase, FkbM family n=1 Tax=uncultured Caudovirales phage TaxID=2100421 RepID=A0A6J5P4Z5_9CAUD|nr:fkbM_fam, methyltransferase, FkbM family [uncultured Caudovirales phage]
MFSQNDEERYILQWTPPQGRLLDIGAWWPTNLSNTRALIEKGWSGVLVEPSPGPMRVLLGEYGGNDKITLLQAAVTSHGKRITMQVTDYPVSTSDHKVYSIWQTDPLTQYLGPLVVPSLTIANVFEEFGRFDFIDIDAEGQSVELVTQLLESSEDLLPQCFCVEHDGYAPQIEVAARKRGYTNFHITGENLVAAR